MKLPTAPRPMAQAARRFAMVGCGGRGGGCGGGVANDGGRNEKCLASLAHPLAQFCFKPCHSPALDSAAGDPILPHMRLTRLYHFLRQTPASDSATGDRRPPLHVAA